MTTRGTIKFQVTLQLEGSDEDTCVAIEAEGYDDPGRTYGPPENCYPAEGECNILSSKDAETGREIPWSLIEPHLSKIEDTFFEELYEQTKDNYADYCDSEYDRIRDDQMCH